MDENDLRLPPDDPLCFPLYACAKEIVRRYTPLLEPLDLTYTQYIAMMALWEKPEMPVKELGRALWLDSGTLTPVLKKLEAKGYVIRRRSESDERCVLLSLTEAGAALRAAAAEIPARAGECICLEKGEAESLCALLGKILNGLR